MRFSTNLVPLRLEPSESASLGDSYHARRVRLNLMTLINITNLNSYIDKSSVTRVFLYNIASQNGD